MRCASFAMSAALLAEAACAVPRVAAPTALEAYSATLPVSGLDDFSEIPDERCDPPLVGLFMTHRAALELVRGVKLRLRDCELRLIAVEGERDIMAERARSLAEESSELAPLRAWALVGKIGVGVGILSVVAAIVATVIAVSKE